MPAIQKKEKWRNVVEGMRLDLSQPYNEVTAAQIKQYAGEEPRLMAYVDKEEDLPPLFRAHGIFPLPVSRGTYALVKGRGFHTLEPVGEPRVFISRLSHRLITTEGSHSEAARLSYAYNVGLFDHFSGASGLRPMALGRSGTDAFHFFVNNRTQRVNVDKAQIEVDAAYENAHTILLAEAKTAPYRSFINRQLYYPFRQWKPPADLAGKTVRNLFVTIDPDEPIFNFWEYEWEDPLDYEGITCVQKGAFQVVENLLPPENFAEVTPSDVAFEIPQADDFFKVMQFPLAIYQGINDRDLIAEYFGFDPRQSSYYRRAAEALGLVTQDQKTWKYLLTAEGNEYVALTPDKRFEFLTDRLLQLPIMNEIFMRALKKRKEGVGKKEIAEAIRETSRNSGTTLGRRAQTIFSWFGWMADTLGLVVIEGDRIYIRPNSRQARLE